MNRSNRQPARQRGQRGWRQIVGLIVCLAWPAVPQAAPVTLDAQAEARIVKPLRVTPTRELDFGSLAVLNLNVLRDATLTIAPSGAASATGGLLGFWVSIGRHPGEALVSGETQLAYVVSAPANVDLPWGNNTLTVRDFRFTSATRGGEGGSGYIAQLDGGGGDRLAIGGTLAFPRVLVGARANLLSRSLSITVPVTVQYQ